MDTDRFNLKKLNEEEVKEQYQVTIKNRFSALENLEDYGDINRAWDAIRENIKFLPESVSVILKQSVINHSLMTNFQNWLIEGSRLSYSGCKDPSVANENNVSNVRREGSRHFRQKKREYLKDNMNELE
jgi:hypothetical protein